MRVVIPLFGILNLGPQLRIFRKERTKTHLQSVPQPSESSLIGWRTRRSRATPLLWKIVHSHWPFHKGSEPQDNLLPAPVPPTFDIMCTPWVYNVKWSVTKTPFGGTGYIIRTSHLKSGVSLSWIVTFEWLSILDRYRKDELYLRTNSLI